MDIHEKSEVLGGLLALGIPDFKLDKNIISRRTDLMQAEGVEFKTNVNIGVDVKTSQLQNDFDAVVLCGGSEEPRNLEVEGRELDGIFTAGDMHVGQSLVVRAINEGRNVADSVNDFLR